MKKKLALLLLFVCLSLNLCAEKVIYDLPADPIDVVIVSHPKDKDTLDYCIEGIRKNGKNIRRVVVVSPIPLTEQAEWFDEALFPFNKADISTAVSRGDQKVADHVFTDRHSVGWYYQQLLKLYSSFVIPNLSSNVLIMDADVIFMNPVSFLNEKNGGLFCYKKKQGKTEYFEHAKRLVPSYNRIHYSIYSVAHHMLFQRAILQDLFDSVENYHKTAFWVAFCHCVDTKNIGGASEYEIYYNYALNHTKQVNLRPLKWKNDGHLEYRKRFEKEGYHFVAFHTYLRDRLRKK